jgi:hypothetical protein
MYRIGTRNSALLSALVSVAFSALFEYKMQGCSPWSHGGRLPHVPEREPRIRRRRSSSCSRYRRRASSLLAVTHAIDDDNGVCQHCVTPLKLRASGFVDPDLADGPATGALLSLIIARERQATLPYRIGTIGQLFSINGSRTKAAMR